MQSMETPKEALSHHVSASGLDSFNYQHHHNFSHIENPKGSILSNPSTDPTTNQANSLSKVLKDKKYKKMLAERTHTPPPPTS